MDRVSHITHNDALKHLKTISCFKYYAVINNTQNEETIEQWFGKTM